MARAAAHPNEPSEDELAIQVADFLRVALPPEIVWWHTPNGGERPSFVRTNKAGDTYRFSPEAKKLKRMGVLPGVYDLIFIMPNGQAAVLELKVGKNDLSGDQIFYRDRMIRNGCACRTAWSLAEVAEILTGWLGHYGLTLRAQPFGGCAA